MSFRRRGTIDILLELIRESRLATNKTRLTNKVNLNYVQFKKYATLLEEKGFIMKVSPPTITHKKGKNRLVKFYYIITNKGLKVLDQISQDPLSDLFDIMEEM